MYRGGEEEDQGETVPEAKQKGVQVSWDLAWKCFIALKCRGLIIYMD